MTKGSKLTINYAVEKTTPGAVRYIEVDSSGAQLKGDADGAKAPTIYFRKAALGGEIPQRLTVTVEAA